MVATKINWLQILGGGAALVAIIGFGYTIGTGKDEALVKYLQVQNQKLEDNEKNLRAEVENLKLELKSSRDKTTPTSAAVGFIEDSDKLNGTGTVAKPAAKKAVYKNPVIVTLSSENTAQLFDGQLFLTLQAISFEGNPLRHRVFATVGTPGKPNKDIVGVDSGFAMVYEGFEIRVTETDTFNAKFLVTRLDAPKS
jgi:hypothetical protein